jgi:hypothetical protein
MIYQHTKFQDPKSGVSKSGVRCVLNTEWFELLRKKLWSLAVVTIMVPSSVKIGQLVAKSKLQTV